MNATNRPVDLLLNIESPSINLAQRRGVGPSSNQNSELSALNRRENSFGDVYRQQRRDDNEVRQAAQQKRSAEPAARQDNRSVHTQENASQKQSRAEAKGSSNGKALPHSSPTKHGADDSVAARESAETTVDGDGATDLALAEDAEVTVSFEDVELVEGGDIAAQLVAEDDAEQQLDSEGALNLLQGAQAASQTADVDAKARSAQVSGVAADVAREFKQGRLGEAVEGAIKGEVNASTQSKATGVGGEQSGLQLPQDRLAQLTAATDFKVLREQLAAGTIKVDAGTTGGAKGAVDALNAADTSSDRQPRLNALTQASQALAKPGVVSASVQQPVGSPEWGQAMSQRIMWLVNRGISAAELQLNPRDLGPVDVRINVSGEQTTVQFSSQQAAVREALESSVVRLREMMESSGLNLADVDVSDQSQSEQAQADAGDASGNSSTGETDDAEGGTQTGVTEGIESDGLVDFYA